MASYIIAGLKNFKTDKIRVKYRVAWTTNGMTKFKCNSLKFKARLDKIYDHLYPDFYCWISTFGIEKGNPFKVPGQETRKDPDKRSDVMDGSPDWSFQINVFSNFTDRK